MTRIKQRKATPNWREKYYEMRRERDSVLRRNQNYLLEISDVRAKLTVALSKLEDLAAGLVPTDISNANPTCSWDVKMRMSAARTLKEIAKMKERVT